MQSNHRRVIGVIATALPLTVAVSGCTPETAASPSVTASTGASATASASAAVSPPAPPAAGGCTLEVWTDANPTHGSSTTAVVGDEVRLEGTFIGDADVSFTLTIGGVEAGGFTTTADATGLVTDSLRFEQKEAGKAATVTGVVEATECAASVEVIIVAP